MSYDERLFDTIDEMHLWRHGVMREIHHHYGRHFHEVHRDGVEGDTQHFVSVSLPPTAPTPSFLTVHPLTCECTDAPHIAREPVPDAYALQQEGDA